MSTVQAIGIGCNIVVFSMRYKETRVYIYDVVSDHWWDVDVEDLKNLFDYSCVKILYLLKSYVFWNRFCLVQIFLKILSYYVLKINKTVYSHVNFLKIISITKNKVHKK